MLTIRENFMETIRGGHPDRFVKQYEYQEWINDPLVSDLFRKYHSRRFIILSFYMFFIALCIIQIYNKRYKKVRKILHGNKILEGIL